MMAKGGIMVTVAVAADGDDGDDDDADVEVDVDTIIAAVDFVVATFDVIVTEDCVLLLIVARKVYNKRNFFSNFNFYFVFLYTSLFSFFFAQK